MPGTDLFADHCDEIIANHGLERCRITGGVASVTPDGDVMLGDGGATAGHLALGAARRGGRVTLISRRPLIEREFDTEPGWLGPLRMEPFLNLETAVERAKAAISARDGGSIPSWLLEELHTAIGAGWVRLDRDDLGPRRARRLKPDHSFADGWVMICPDEYAMWDATEMASGPQRADGLRRPAVPREGGVGIPRPALVDGRRRVRVVTATPVARSRDPSSVTCGDVRRGARLASMSSPPSSLVHLRRMFGLHRVVASGEAARLRLGEQERVACEREHWWLDHVTWRNGRGAAIVSVADPDCWSLLLYGWNEGAGPCLDVVRKRLGTGP